jgi:hypothetical protein
MTNVTNLIVVDCGNSNEYPNQCVSGFVKNNDTCLTGCFLIIQTSGQTIERKLAPLQSYNFQNLYFKSFKNTGPTQLEVETSNQPGSQSSMDIQQLDIGAINGTVNVNGNVTISGITDVNITNSTLNVNGTVNINGIVDVSIQNTTVNVSGAVSVSNSTLNVNGIVSISNATLNVGGTVNINGIVDVSIQNTTVNVSGGVSIVGTADVSITNSTIDINGSVSISSSVQLPTDIGNYAQSLQENQTNGTNLLTYNPWNFSTGVIPSVGAVGNLKYANVQRNGASGYLLFNFCLYNPLTTTSSATITVYLYADLPTSGPNATPLNQFSFNSGNINPNSALWVTVIPNINWNYNSLVVIPQQETGNVGAGIGVMIPATFNNINSHYWGGTYWNSSDDGFVGYWTIINAAPASLPVSVTNPIEISKGYAASITTVSTTNFVCPPGKRIKILSIQLIGVASGTQAYLGCVLIRTTTTIDEFPAVFYNITTISGDTYYLIASTSVPQGIIKDFWYGQHWSESPVLYPGDHLSMDGPYEFNTPQINVYYVVENL